MFERKGQIYIDATRFGEDAALEAALDAGAEDMKREGDQFIVTTDPTSLHQVKGALEAKGLAIQESEIANLPARRTLENAGLVEVGRTAEAVTYEIRL